MSLSAGTGQPIYFRCARCRRTAARLNPHPREPSPFSGGFAVELTGRVRPVKPGHGGARVTFTRREYRCKHCGHVGWSRHADLERAAAERAKS